MASMENRCISYQGSERCTNRVKGKSKHCKSHIKECSDLHKKYKSICENAKIIGNCDIKDIKNMDLEELSKYVTKFRLAYNRHKNCHTERVNFQDKCVAKECRDEGHEKSIKFEEDIVMKCENVLSKLSERIQQEQKLIEEKQLQIKKLVQETSKIEKEIQHPDSSAASLKSVDKKGREKDAENIDDIISEYTLLAKQEKEQKTNKETNKETNQETNKETKQKRKIDNNLLISSVYLIKRIFFEPELSFDNFIKPFKLDDKDKLDELINNEYDTTIFKLYDLLQAEDCKKIQLKLQGILLSGYKKFYQHMKEKLRQDMKIPKSGVFKTPSGASASSAVSKKEHEYANTLFELEYINILDTFKKLCLERLKYLEPLNITYITFKRDEFNSLLKLNIVESCKVEYINSIIQYITVLFMTFINEYYFIIPNNKIGLYDRLLKEKPPTYVISLINDYIPNEYKLI